MTEQQLARNAAHRLAVIRHAQEVTRNVAKTCRYDGISRTVYYRWYRRFEAEGIDGIRDRSKRPLVGPRATSDEVVGKIVRLRQHLPLRPIGWLVGWLVGGRGGLRVQDIAAA